MVVTALTQAVLGGIGLAVSGVPYAALLTVVMIFTCLVQLGLYWFWCRRLSGFTGAGHTGHRAAGLSCVVGTMDNVIRPVLIRMGADLP
ncbi:AI-2E family transporter [Klebsiella pneumoniae]|uniref:AI-2E family transporter n=1 Tax=Klebsiella pneumoniae TaxID=573 RepID=A0A939SV73_KLEPN|nr:AI-2E family transporter [Klebsiella pneumoniae]